MNGNVDVLIGAQWGDEGKGKVADAMAAEVDVFVRYQGGANSGRTVVVDGKNIVFRHLPSGMLYHGKLCVLGNGVVVDPEETLKELDELHQIGRDRARLVVSSHAHVVMPYHKILDRAQEGFRGKGRMLGTTGRGIGPCYADKCARSGIRVDDLLDEVRLREIVSSILEEKNRILTKLYGENLMPFDEIYEPAREWGKALAPYVEDTVSLLHESLGKGKNILLEGTQGVLLDLDHGTYPYVTSSCTAAGGCLSGTGLPLTAVRRVIAVAKAYVTRTGVGPMPTEEKGDAGQHLSDKGGDGKHEPGRTLRFGWIDIPALRYAVRVNGCGSIALMKLDVLSGLDEVKVCVAYNRNETKTERFDGSAYTLAECSPVYESMKGWSGDISGCTTFEALPEEARNYVRCIEENAGTPVKLVSVGPGREQKINLGL